MLWLLPFLMLLQARPLSGTPASDALSPQIAFRVAHRDGVRCLVFSPNGRLVATGGDDETIKLWDARNSELLHTMHTPHEVVYSLAFSPDNATLASGSSNGNRETPAHSHALLWETATGKLRLQLGKEGLRGYSEDVASVAYTPDGKVVAVCTRRWEEFFAVGVDLRDAQTGVLLRHITADSAPSNTGFSALGTPVFSPDGHTLATISTALSGTAQAAHFDVKLWGVETGALQRTLTGEDVPLHSLLFSPDGQTLAGACGAEPGPGKILLWDTRTGAKKQVLVRNRYWIYALAFAPNSKTLAGAQMGILAQTHDGVEPAMDLHTPVSGEAIVWDVATGKPLQILHRQGWIGSLAYSPDGSRLVTVHSGRMLDTRGLTRSIVSLWNPATGALLHSTSSVNLGGLDHIAYAPDRKTLVMCGGLEGSVRWLDAKTLKQRSFAPGQRDHTVPIAFSPDGHLFVTGGENGDLALLWNLRTVRPEWQLPADSFGWTTAVAFAADGKTVAALRPDFDQHGVPGELSLWDIPTGFRQFELKKAFQPFPRTPPLARGPIARPAPVWPRWNAIAFAPDGHTFLGGGQANGGGNVGGSEQGKEGLIWWDLPSGTMRFVPQADTGEVYALAVAPNGKLVATSGQYETILWDATTGAQIRKMRTLFPGGSMAQTFREGTVRSLAFSPDSRTLASGDTNSVRLWNVADGVEISRLEGHTGPIPAVAFSPDGTLLASASEDGDVRLWDLSTRKVRSVLTHDRPMTSVTFSPDGRLLASGSAEGEIRFWNARTAALLLTLQVFPARDDHSPSIWIAYTPEGFYEGSPGIADYLRWQVGDRLLPAATFAGRYHRKDLIKAALNAP